MKATKDRIAGMFLGIAIGDALFMPAENLSIEEKNRRYGKRITSYLRPDGHKWFDGRQAGTWTDDTQLTLLIAESLIENRGINVDDLAKRHVTCRIEEGDLGFGPTTRSALNKLERGVHWSLSGKSDNPKHGFGNGLPMKVSPIGALRASLFWEEQWVEYRSKFIDDIVNLSLMTHYRRMAIDSALSHVFAINLCLSNNFTIENFIQEILKWSDFLTFSEIKPYTDRLTQRFNQLKELDYRTLTDEQIIEMFNGGTSYVYNSLPFSYAFFLRNPRSIETLYDVGNSGGDTDTNASIVGGLLGALNGASVFPSHLIERLWQKERILATAEKFYETFFQKKED